MHVLLAFSRGVDWLNEIVGRVVAWLVLVAVLVSAGNALTRYAFNVGSNAWLELQWYLFSAVFLLAAGWALKRNAHVRIDILSSRLGPRGQACIDIGGTLLFLLPMALSILYLAWPMFMQSYATGEVSSDAGGLARWPVKLLIPIGFGLLILQGLSELVKRIAVVRGLPAPADESPKR